MPICHERVYSHSAKSTRSSTPKDSSGRNAAENKDRTGQDNEIYFCIYDLAQDISLYTLKNLASKTLADTQVTLFHQLSLPTADQFDPDQGFDP